MRLTARVAGLSMVSCLLFFVACSSDDDAAPGGGEDGDGGSSGKSSSGTSGQNASGSSGTSGSAGDGGDDPDADKPVVVGDGSLGAACNKDDECDSKICATGHRCVAFASCRASKNGATPGVDTCGAAEPGNDDCCTSLTLPTTTTRTLDKYEITAGRMRAFVESIPGKNFRKWAKDYAKANPTSELGKLDADFPGYLEGMTDGKSDSDTPLAIWLGAFPQDAINYYDGCYVQAGISGAATYWQDPATLKPYEIGYGSPPDGKRKYSQAVLDKKPLNCVPPVLLATFCAWDGGELARPSDYYEVWGHTQEILGPNEFGQSGAKFTKPWAAMLKVGEFNWMNGHGTGCPMPGWPGCDPAKSDDSQVPFFSFPKTNNPSDDDSPEIGAPGRFPKDVTATKSPDGAGWFDLGGNLLEAAWPKQMSALATLTQNFCNTAAPVDAADPSYCNRDQPASGPLPAEARPGSAITKGQNPTVSLIGASFEGHIGYGEAYFANATDDETKLLGYGVPAQFQYGKVGGRCARVKK